MPKELEAKLKRSGKKKGLIGKRLKSYIYGTMNKLGLMKDKKSKTKYQRNK
jgi:hypothetical protein